MTAANTHREPKETMAETAAKKAKDEEAMAQTAIDDEEIKAYVARFTAQLVFWTLAARTGRTEGENGWNKGRDGAIQHSPEGDRIAHICCPSPSSPATAAVSCSRCWCLRRCSLMLRGSLSSPSSPLFPLPLNCWLPP